MIAPKLGLQLSSLTDDIGNDKAINSTFLKVAEMGIKYVQLQGIPADVKDSVIVKALNNTGLECVATQEDYVLGFGENPGKAIKRAVSCGAKYISFALIPFDIDSLDKMKAFSEKLMPIYEKVKSAGMILSFHPIGYDFRPLEGRPAYASLMDMLPDDVQLTYCVHSGFESGANHAEILSAYKNKVDLVHFKNSVEGEDEKRVLTPVGDGDIDYRPIYDLCCENGVKYVFAEQEKHDNDPFDDVMSSMRYLESLQK